MKKSILLLALLFGIITGFAQAPVANANYNLAARFSLSNVKKVMFSTTVEPVWLKKSDRFWYAYSTNDGKKWYIVDPEKRTKKELFDVAKMAANISRIVKDPFDAQHLPINDLIFTEDEKSIRFSVNSTGTPVEVQHEASTVAEVSKMNTTVQKKDSLQKGKVNTTKRLAAVPQIKKKFIFEYNIASQELKEVEPVQKNLVWYAPGWASLSPDSSVAVFCKNHNLYMIDRENLDKAKKNENDSTIVEHQLTFDGAMYFGYSEYSYDSDAFLHKDSTIRRLPGALWSPDSKHFAITLRDARKRKDLWLVYNTGNSRPYLATYKFDTPGEKDGVIDYIVLGNVEQKSVKKLNVGRFKDQTVWAWGITNKNNNIRNWRIWNGTDTSFLVTRTSRDFKRVDYCLASVNADTLKPLIEERMNTYVDTRELYPMDNYKEFIHWSERDGWGHFYLYDQYGNIKNQITSGPFHCEKLVYVDEKKRIVYFIGNGKETGEDPYYQHLYRVNFDGSGLKLLNAGNFDHKVNMAPSTKFFVNNFSRVNTIPESAVYDQNGKKVLTLEKADLSQLFAAGYQFPETFVVKADDAVTDLYGVMYKPFDFDSTKKYPIITYVYPGPQTEVVNKSFNHPLGRVDRLAQLGFIVITVGHRGGSPERSKWYHNYGYGNLRDYGLADKKKSIEQLALRHSFIDISRVGITGHSGGGFMSTAAMLVYPDFFKVAVSVAGNHENNIYDKVWSEKHHGVKEVISAEGDTSFQFSIPQNSKLAKNLKGRLLLVTGDMDFTVHPANTLRMATALINANKRFDLMVFPGIGHSFEAVEDYFFWLTADYFSKHLLNDAYQPVDIIEMMKDEPATYVR